MTRRTSVSLQEHPAHAARLLLVLLAAPAVALGALVALAVAGVAALLGPLVALALLVKRGLPAHAGSPRNLTPERLTA